MSASKKKNRKTNRKPIQNPPKKPFPVIRVSLIMGMVAVIGGIIIVLANLNSTNRNQSSKSESTVSESKTQATASPNTPGAFENLTGRWLRPDGGYIIEIRSIDADGRADATYFNPRPIHVSQAEISWKNGIQEVFIELQDKGYPGSTYTLDYHPDQDMLIGIYFQAVLRQTFEVVFVRKK